MIDTREISMTSNSVVWLLKPELRRTWLDGMRVRSACLHHHTFAFGAFEGLQLDESFFSRPVARMIVSPTMTAYSNGPTHTTRSTSSLSICNNQTIRARFLVSSEVGDRHDGMESVSMVTMTSGKTKQNVISSSDNMTVENQAYCVF
jgi:hypothetical protein